jgi:hypothetical protein
MANGPTFSTRFASPGPKQVTVTAFNAKGCSVRALRTAGTIP